MWDGVPVEDSAVFVSLCVSGDASRALTETQRMILNVRFDVAGAEVAPTPPPKQQHGTSPN